MSLQHIHKFAHQLQAKNVQKRQKQQRLRTPLPALCLITDRFTLSNICQIIPTLPVPCLIVIRDYQHPHRFNYAKTIAHLCRIHAHLYIVADDIKLAMSINAHGIHIPAYNVASIPYIKKKHPNWIITSSAHNLNEIQTNNPHPIDIVFLSPLFMTSSHPKQPALKMKEFNILSSRSHHMIYALGGINRNNYQQLNTSKATGFASISLFKTPKLLHL